MKRGVSYFFYIKIEIFPLVSLFPWSPANYGSKRSTNCFTRAISVGDKAWSRETQTSHSTFSFPSFSSLSAVVFPCDAGTNSSRSPWCISSGSPWNALVSCNTSQTLECAYKKEERTKHPAKPSALLSLLRSPFVC